MKLRASFKVGTIVIMALTLPACLDRNFVPPPTASLSTVGLSCNTTSIESPDLSAANTHVILPAVDGTPVPQQLAVMSTDNAPHVVRLARWGKGAVIGINWSPDGNVIAMTTPYGVYLFNSKSLSLERFISVEKPEAVIVSAFSSDSKLLATGTVSGTVQLWQANDGVLLREFTLEGYVSDLSMSPDGSLIAVAGTGGKIWIWQTNDGNKVHEISSISSEVEFSPNGEFIATAEGEVLQLWRVSDGALIHELNKGEWAIIVGFAFSPDKATIATSSFDGTIRIWRLNDGKLIRQFDTGVHIPSHISFSPDGNWLATDGATSAVNLYRVSDGGLERLFKGQTSLFAFSPDSQLIATRSSYGTVQVLATNDGHVIGELDGTAPLQSLAIGPDGSLIATGGPYLLKVRQTLTGNSLCVISAHEQTIFGVAFSPDGTLIASGGYDGVARIWQASDGKLMREIKPEVEKGDNLVYLVAFSPDGEMLALGNTSETLFLYQVADGKLIGKLNGHHDRVDSIAFSPDGQMIAAAGYDAIKLWRVSDGQLLREFIYKIISSVAFSPDGKLLAAAGSREVKVWQVNNGKEIFTFGGHRNVVESVIFNPNGDLLVSSSADGLIRIWNVQHGGNLLVTLQGHRIHPGGIGGVNKVSFTPDGKLLISVGNDGTVGLWGVQQ